MYMYVYMYICMCMYVCVCIYRYMCTCRCMCMCIYANSGACLVIETTLFCLAIPVTENCWWGFKLANLA